MKVFVVTYSYHDYYGASGEYIGCASTYEGARQVIKKKANYISGLSWEILEAERIGHTFDILEKLSGKDNSLVYGDHEWNIIEENLNEVNGA